jgi:hypothetical protein
MKGFLRSILPSVVVGAVVGLIVLGVGGRILMRIIAHWEGRQPVLSPDGTLTVVTMGTIAGTAAGIIYGLLRRFIKSYPLQIVAFFVFCVVVTLYGVKELLVRPKLLFVGLTLVYCAIVAAVSSKVDTRASNIEELL